MRLLFLFNSRVQEPDCSSNVDDICLHDEKACIFFPDSLLSVNHEMITEIQPSSHSHQLSCVGFLFVCVA